MNRRDMMRVLGGALALPLLAGLPAERLAALGRAAHRRARARAGGFTVLDPHQAETVATIAEMIIPETDTPGARAAHVPEFIDLMLAEWFADDDRARFLAGLADVDERSRDRKSTRLNSSHLVISYAVFCLKKKKKIIRSYVHSRDTS